MKERTFRICAAIVFVLWTITLWHLEMGMKPVHAQAITAASPYSFGVTGALANCPAVASGATQYCFTTTGIYQSISGAAWTLVGASSAVTLTVNGTTKTLPASFTIASSAPTVTASATPGAITAN